jgi:hypothetical protein
MLIVGPIVELGNVVVRECMDAAKERCGDRDQEC